MLSFFPLINQPCAHPSLQQAITKRHTSLAASLATFPVTYDVREMALFHRPRPLLFPPPYCTLPQAPAMAAAAMYHGPLVKFEFRSLNGQVASFTQSGNFLETQTVTELWATASKKFKEVRGPRSQCRNGHAACYCFVS